MPEQPPSQDRYREAGVDIAAGNALVTRISRATRSTARPGADGEIGGFGGLFDLKPLGLRDPLLVASTDGVGTKLRLLLEADRHETAGSDLVAMCVNDLGIQGASPLFFLDYFATGKLKPAVAARVVDGIAEGCRQAGCALIGGETAEMPGHYQPGDYDLAGFAVGALERDALLPRNDLQAGDIVLGLASHGVHSNGFSLVRLILQEQGLTIKSPCPFASDVSFADALLAPTRIYVRSCLEVIAGGGVKALAHITGGGLAENLPRVLPDGLAARIDVTGWPLPPVFRWLAEAGRLQPAELTRTFNAGIGMAVICARPDAARVARALREAGETVHDIGALVEADGARHCQFEGLASWPNA